jgi:hypothetical protein
MRPMTRVTLIALTSAVWLAICFVVAVFLVAPAFESELTTSRRSRWFPSSSFQRRPCGWENRPRSTGRKRRRVRSHSRPNVPGGRLPLLRR